MIITHASKHRWQRIISTEPLNDFTTKKRKRIKTSLDRMTEAGVKFTIEPLTEAFFEQFTPLYKQIVGNKDNAEIHDVFSKTIGKEFVEFPYYGVRLYENDTYLGGSIFSKRADMLAVAFRALQHNWQTANLPAGPTLLAEYFVSAYAAEQGISIISHGKDRNPYGLNSDIGLATFKLSLGCRAFIPEDAREYEVTEIDTDTMTTDALILAYPGEQQVVTDAYLVMARGAEEQYAQLLTYTDQLKVHALYRN